MVLILVLVKYNNPDMHTFKLLNFCPIGLKLPQINKWLPITLLLQIAVKVNAL